MAAFTADLSTVGAKSGGKQPAACVLLPRADAALSAGVKRAAA